MTQFIWHPEQKSHVESDGSYVLEIPVSDDREIIMEILKHGDQVRVIAPVSVKKKIIDSLKRSLENCEKAS